MVGFFPRFYRALLSPISEELVSMVVNRPPRQTRSSRPQISEELVSMVAHLQRYMQKPH